MKPLARVLLSVLTVALVGAVAVLAAFVVGVRTKNPSVLRAARVIQRDVMNRGAMRTAGTTESPWTIIRHRGRSSGTVYETPIGTHREGDLFYVTIPYGPGTQWLRNVLAAGGATLITGGEEIEVVDPRVVPIETTPMAQKDRAAIAIFGVTDALVLRVASSGHA